MKKFTLATLAMAMLLTLPVGALAATVTKAEYKTAKSEISANLSAEKKACAAKNGNAKDICLEEAKGRSKVARAQLEENYAPSTRHGYQLRMARADAAYGVAKEKCDDNTGNTKDVCRKEAKSAYVTAKANAKLDEKTTQNNATANEKASDAKMTALEKNAAAQATANKNKNNAAFALAKEKRDAYNGDVKTNCVKDAKSAYGQN